MEEKPNTYSKTKLYLPYVICVYVNIGLPDQIYKAYFILGNVFSLGISR